MVNKNELKTIINKIKSIITLKTELYDHLMDFLEVLLELNDKYNQLENNTSHTTNKLFAPYYYLGSSNKINIKDYYNKTNCNNITLAFLNCDHERPQWSDGITYHSGGIDDIVHFIHEKQGNIIISSGGANGIELINKLSVEECIKIYKYMYDIYQIKHFDFDIEGFYISDNNLTNKRCHLIKEIKRQIPNAIIQYTIPISPDGLHTEGLNLLKLSKQNNIDPDIINLMTMDFGTYYAPNGKTDMAKYCIQCIESVQKQLNELSIHSKIGVTPMIGVNDCTDEIFSIDNANELINYCKYNNNVKLVSFWCINRDNGNKINNNYADCNYSGIEQKLYEFSCIFNKINQ